MPLLTIEGKQRFEERWRGAGSFIEVAQILSHTSGEQEVIVFESTAHGKVMVIDDVVQLTERDEAKYHEMMAFVPTFAHANPKDILLIGAGDGGVASRLVTHPGVQSVTNIEIDSTVVDVSKEFFPSVHKNVFSHPKFTLKIEDGAVFMAESERTFDVIIVDCSDPDETENFNNVLFSQKFFEDAHKRLNPGGIFITQSGVPSIVSGELKDASQKLKSIFKYTSCFLIDLPMYAGGNDSVCYATNELSHLKPTLEILEKRFADSGVQTTFYTPEFHLASFVPPKHIKELING